MPNLNTSLDDSIDADFTIGDKSAIQFSVIKESYSLAISELSLYKYPSVIISGTFFGKSFIEQLSPSYTSPTDFIYDLFYNGVCKTLRASFQNGMINKYIPLYKLQEKWTAFRPDEFLRPHQPMCSLSA